MIGILQKRNNSTKSDLYWKNSTIKKLPFRPQAVLFDYDGVLGDTMKDNFLAWRSAFRKYGVHIKKTEYFLLEGMRVKGIVKILGKNYSVNKKFYLDIVQNKEKFYLKKNKFKIFPGVLKVLEKCRKNKIKTALVSGASSPRLYATLSKNFLNKFNVILTADSVNKTKPHPEPYLTALRKLKIKAEQAVVIENAPLGIVSAKRAGIYCIAVASTLPSKYLFQADIVIDKINCLQEFIG